MTIGPVALSNNVKWAYHPRKTTLRTKHFSFEDSNKINFVSVKSSRDDDVDVGVESEVTAATIAQYRTSLVES